jgi:hypothetical protein
MKKLITEIQEQSGSTYQLWAELINNEVPKGHKTLAFSSVWTGAKSPKEHQTKCKFMFSPESLANLKELLESA